MKKPSSWTVNVKSLSHQAIVELLRELHGSFNTEVVLELQREFILRLTDRGIDKPQIIRRLAHGVPRGSKLTEIAREWAQALDITVEEFMRIANVK